MEYVGIDGCKIGWFYIRLGEKESFDFGVLKSIDELPQIACSKSFVCIDIPIGLKEHDTQERRCDKEARRLLKKKGSSVFPAPSRLSLDANEYQIASALNKKFTGRKLTLQSFFISKKIKEVDAFVRNSGTAFHIRECHPELCFFALNNFEPLKYSKKKKEGRTERKCILSKYIPSASTIIASAAQKYLRKHVALDDILDAMVVALTASFEDNVLSVPHSPEFDNQNLRMEIVYPPHKPFPVS